MINFKKLYKNIVIGRKYIKLINFFHFEKIDLEELIIKPDEKYLILAPHFDDETFGCGGLLIKYPQNAHIICLTDSRFGTVIDNNEELVDIRKKEFISVMDELGVTSYEFLDIQDGKLIYNYEKFKQIDISEYDYIFIPNYFENHKDHKAVTPLLKQLLKEKKSKNSLRIAMYEIWSAMSLPNFFIDITPIKQKKAELMNLYASQIKNIWFTEGILGLNTYRGMLSNRGSAEMYTIIDKKTFKKI